MKDGEAVAVWNRYGEHRQVIGPRLVRLFFSTIRFLDKKTAGPKEYLRVSLTNGNVEHMRGPVTLYANPVMHSRVEVLPAITLLAASDCIVVHRQADTGFDKSSQPSGLSNESIHRVIVKGPNTYYPGPRETLLMCPQFLSKRGAEDCVYSAASRPWTVEVSYGANKSKGKLTLAFRFAVTDVELMLDHTSDLMGDLLEAVIADLTNFSSTTADINALERLNSFSFFPILLGRSASMGVSMEAVAYRGYELSAESKRDEDREKEMNMKISNQAMQAEQEERRIAADIAARRARLAMEHDLDDAVLAGKQARLVAEQEFYQKQQEYEEQLERRRLGAQLEHHQLSNDESLRVLKGLKDLGTDITKLLCEGDKASKRALSENRDHTTGRDTLIAVSPPLRDWFSVPSSGPTVVDGKASDAHAKL